MDADAGGQPGPTNSQQNVDVAAEGNNVSTEPPQEENAAGRSAAGALPPQVTADTVDEPASAVPVAAENMGNASDGAVNASPTQESVPSTSQSGNQQEQQQQQEDQVHKQQEQPTEQHNADPQSKDADASDQQQQQLEDSSLPSASQQLTLSTSKNASTSRSIDDTTSTMATSSSSSGEDPCASLQQVLSFAAAKRGNLHLLDDETLALAAGCMVVLLHLPSMSQRYLPGRDGGGVAALAVHPSRTVFLVAEKCHSRQPNIYIYRYPELELAHTLPGGTERAYSAACFSPDGSKLAAVGNAPDYLLTLWDWAAGATLLRSKAFSQEVYSLGFCPHNPGHLVSCGTGHIRFWKMAATFTGLKLQGALGRFGAVELSDVAAFVELPDGKVLSGSEVGDLLLWEGGLIKAVIMRPGGAHCHDGPIEVLLHDTQSNYIVSGGGDDIMRLWQLNSVQDAEPQEGCHTAEVAPAATVKLFDSNNASSDGGRRSTSGSGWSGSGSSGGKKSGRAGGARCLLWLNRRTWLVQSEGGALLKVSLPLNLLDQAGYTVSHLMHLQAGGVVGCSTCPDRHVLLAASADGTITALDYRSHTVLQRQRFASRISSMAMLPVSVDPLQRTVVLGFADGSVRVVTRCSDGWGLLAAARPHKVPVVCLAVSSDGSRLAAIAATGRVFFLLLGQSGCLEPQIAWQLSESSPSCCCWNEDGTRLLVGCSSTGIAVELEVPTPGSLDTSRTFDQLVPSRRFKATLPTQRQVQEQASSLAATAAAAAAGQVAGTEAAEGENASTSDPSAAGIPKQELRVQLEASMSDAAIDIFAEQPVLPITWAKYQPGSRDRFLLWVSGPAAGQVLECSWGLNRTLSSSVSVPSATVSVLSSSWSGGYRLTGTTDGQVRIEEVNPASGKAIGRPWQCALHDMQEGQVSGLAMAFDNSCVISAAADGTMLLLENPIGTPVAAAAQAVDVNAGLPSMAEAAADTASDLTTEALTLEEAKQAAQSDQQAATTAAARQQLVAAVDGLRRELAVLLAENEARPPAERVPQEALRVDKGLEALVQCERAASLASVQSQVAYDAEVAQIKLEKLQQYFDATVSEHVVVVHAFTAGPGGRGRSISTFRPPELPRELLASIAEAQAEELDQQQQPPSPQAASSKMFGHSKSMVARGLAPGVSFKKGKAARGEASEDPLASGPSAPAASRAEQWRRAKRARAAEWATFNASRPDDAYEAPADVAALQDAAATIGDFKLKSDPGFLLPEAQRWTPARKRHQMLLLMRQLSAARTGHNNRVLQHRLRKRELVTQLNALQDHLAVVSKLLGVSENLQHLAMQPDEEPEQHLLQVTDSHLAGHIAAKKAAADKAAGFGGLGGFAAGSGANKPAAAAAGTDAAGTAGSSKHGAAGGGSKGQAQMAAADAGAGAEAAQPALAVAQRHRLQVERQNLLASIASLKSSFDASVAECRAEQLELAVNLKAAEGQLLLMLKELALLKEAEVRELVLEAKRDAKLAEAADMADKLAEVGSALDDKHTEAEAAAERRAAVVAELEVLLAQQEAFKDALTKVFFRRIKRAKRRGPGSAGSDNDSSDDDIDGGNSDMGGDDGTGSDSSGSEEVCPPGCEPSLYEAVVELRERRLDEEETAAEVSKAAEAISKEKTMISKKAKLLDTSLAAINQEVIEFQVDKQARLNQLAATVSLRRHQVACGGAPLQPTSKSGSSAAAGGAAAGFMGATVQGAAVLAASASVLPADLSDTLVFSSVELDKLKRRMQELDDERDMLHRQQKDLRHQYRQLQEDKAAKEAHLAELNAHCRDVQMLKFGQVIDVSMLDGIGLRNKTADELREAIKKQAAASTKELSDWDARIVSKRRGLLGLMRENTAALATVTDLTRSQRDLETGVLAGRAALWQDPLDARRVAVAERDKLVAQINSQAGQLDALRAQIAALKRKDSAVHG